MTTQSKEYLHKYPWLAHALPFFLFIALTEAANWLPAALSPWLYIVKTLTAAALLWHWRHSYHNDLSQSLSSGEWCSALFCGLIVLFLWVGGEPWLPKMTVGRSFHPDALGESTTAITFLLGFRLAGSTLVVPLMEELFWRSLLMRFLIEKDFSSVPQGSFTWFSFTATALLFGLEHNRIAAGVIAGILYGALLVRQKKLRGVIFAHAVTNFGLGIHVIATGSWVFW